LEISDRNEIWRYIKKERGRKEWPDENIKEEQWRMNFMNLLDGRGEKDRREEISSMERNSEDENERITVTTELYRAKKRLKRKKAAGEDGLKNEVWLQADNGTMDILKRIMQRICDTGEIPEGWKER